jgi:hypothetical protein
MFISKNSKWKWWYLWGCDNLENVFAIRICSREPGQHILVEQCLVGVAVTSANSRTELTLFLSLITTLWSITFLLALLKNG